MQTRSFTIILLRVAATLVMSYGFTQVGQLVAIALRGPGFGDDVAWVFILALLAPVALGIVLWWIAPGVASLATRQLPASIDAGDLTAEGLAHAAFVVIGVWLFLSTLPSLVAVIIAMSGPHGDHQLAWLTSRVLRCVFGLALIIGSRAASKTLLWLRHAGTSGQESGP